MLLLEYFMQYCSHGKYFAEVRSALAAYFHAENDFMRNMFVFIRNIFVFLRNILRRSDQHLLASSPNFLCQCCLRPPSQHFCLKSVLSLFHFYMELILYFCFGQSFSVLLWYDLYFYNAQQ